MRGQDGEEVIALIPTDTDLEHVAAVLKGLGRFKGAKVRDVAHSGTYHPLHGPPQGVMEVFIPASPKV